MDTKFWSPLFLSATVPAMGLNADYSVNPQAIMNPNRGPMLIDQFRFSSPAPTPGAGGTVGYGLDPRLVAVELRLGSVPLMPRPITLAAIAPRYYGGTIISSFIPSNGISFDPMIVWHLPQPLFVPPNVQLFARFTTPALGLGASEPMATAGVALNVRFSVVGRSLAEDEPIPGQIPIPWVTEAKSYATATSWRSQDVELINPHKVPLSVRQFVSARWTPAQGGLVSGTYVTEDMTVQLTASNGIAIVRDPTPYNLLFPDDRGLLEVSAQLQPGQFITAALDHPYVAPADPAPAGQQCVFTTIGMVGYRMVDTPRPNTM